MGERQNPHQGGIPLDGAVFKAPQQEGCLTPRPDQEQDHAPAQNAQGAGFKGFAAFKSPPKGRAKAQSQRQNEAG